MGGLKIVPWQTPKTWNTGDPLNASNLNTFIREQQAALRAAQDALTSRVAALENAASSDAISLDGVTARLDALELKGITYAGQRTIASGTTSVADDAVATNLSPPDNTVLILITARQRTNNKWLQSLALAYDVWSDFSVVPANTSVSSSNRWSFRANEGTLIDAFVCKMAGNVLGFGTTGRLTQAITAVKVWWLS